jgi:hypothetical protein
MAAQQQQGQEMKEYCVSSPGDVKCGCWWKRRARGKMESSNRGRGKGFLGQHAASAPRRHTHDQTQRAYGKRASIHGQGQGQGGHRITRRGGRRSGALQGSPAPSPARSQLASLQCAPTRAPTCSNTCLAPKAPSLQPTRARQCAALTRLSRPCSRRRRPRADVRHGVRTRRCRCMWMDDCWRCMPAAIRYVDRHCCWRDGLY